MDEQAIALGRRMGVVSNTGVEENCDLCKDTGISPGPGHITCWICNGHKTIEKIKYTGGTV